MADLRYGGPESYRVCSTSVNSLVSYRAHRQNDRTNDRTNDHITPPALAEC